MVAMGTGTAGIGSKHLGYTNYQVPANRPFTE